MLKAHLIAGLYSFESQFLLKYWWKLLGQVKLSLNMMKAPRKKPKIYSYTNMFGGFDFNSTPLPPLGTKFMINDKPKNKAPCPPYGTIGWYTRPEM